MPLTNLTLLGTFIYIRIGSWSTVPTCAVSCGAPPTIPNGSRTFTGTTLGETATYTCNTGYQLSDPSTATCQASGSWSTVPTCAVSCGDPPTIPNGSRTFTGTTLGETATYTCNTGYQLSGSPTVTCQASGSWSTVPTCSISCGNPPTIPNGSRTFNGITIGETATYTCNTGYQRSGPSTVTCEASGSWSTIPTCEVDQPVPCDNPPTIPNGFRTFVSTAFGDAAFYTCNTGYQRSGPSNATCQASGSWSTRPTCGAICPPLTLVNGVIAYLPSSSIILEGTVAQHSCNTGYGLSGSGTRICNNNGTTGVWSLPTLSCKGMIIQLRFGGIRDCSQYTASETSQKTDDITALLVQGVTTLCNCGFNSTFLSNAFLKCFADSPQHVTYRATLLSSSELSTSEVLEYIEKWIRSTSSVIIQNLHLNLNATCPTVIADLNSLECPVQVPSSAMYNTAVIVGSVIATIIIILVLIVVFAVVVATTKKHRSTTSVTLENESTGNVNTEETEMSNFSSIPRARTFMILPSPPGKTNPEYEEVGPPQPVVKGGENQYSFGMDPCPAYEQTTLKNTHLK